MGLFENILARAQYQPNTAGFPVVEPPVDESALAAQARDVAGRKLAAPYRYPLGTDPLTADNPYFTQPNVRDGRGYPPSGYRDPRISVSLEPFVTQAGMIAPQSAGLPPVVPNPDVTDIGGGMQGGGLAPAVPLPMARPPEADASTTDVSAAARQPSAAPTNLAPQIAAPPAPAPASSPVEAPSMFGRLGSGLMGGLERNSNALLALGAGFAGAPNIGQAISRASAAVIPAHAADVKQQLDLQSRSYGTQALIAAGVPIQQAIAASGDPDLKKALIQNYIIDRKSEIKSVKSKDAFGNETERLYSVNPFDNTSKEITLGGADGKGGAAAGGKNASFAEGITPETFDHSKVGDEYLSQFSPEMQAGVKAYLRGDSLPTGRQQQAQVIKQIAQKYGDDIGVPANDQAYYQRKNFVNSLGNTNSGVGMQVKGFQQGLEHLTELSSKLEKLGNWNGLGIAPLANAVNAVRGQTTSQADIRKGVDAGAQALAGEIGKLYSGSSGGGVHERSATKALFGPNLSGPEMAGALESTLELMRGGLRTVEQRRDELFPGAEKPRGANFLGPKQEEAISKIESTIKRLRGEAVAPAAAAPTLPSGKTSTGIPWSVN